MIIFLFRVRFCLVRLFSIIVFLFGSIVPVYYSMPAIVVGCGLVRTGQAWFHFISGQFFFPYRLRSSSLMFATASGSMLPEATPATKRSESSESSPEGSLFSPSDL